MNTQNAQSNAMHTPGHFAAFPPAFLPLRVASDGEGNWSVWTAKDDRPGSMNNFVVCETQNRAEAEMFSSAPDMLFALYEMVVVFSSIRQFEGRNWNKHDKDCAENALVKARAAILKARGGAL